MPIWEKLLIAFLIMLVLASLLANAWIFLNRHTTQVPKTDGEISYGLAGQPKLLNPILAADKTDLALTRMIFSGLYTYNIQGKIIPDLSSDFPKISPDGKQYTINLASNNFWHDGTPVTAKDVLFTISKIQDPDLGSPLRGLWLSTEVKAPDLRTVIFSLKETNPDFLQNLTFGLLPEHTWKDVRIDAYRSSPLNQKPFGNGPFTVRQIKRNQSGAVEEISLQQFAEHAHPAFLQNVTVKFYENSTLLLSAQRKSDVDVADFIPSENLSTQLSPTELASSSLFPSYQVLYFNTQSQMINETSVRQALASAIDWQALQDTWQGSLRPISGVPLGLTEKPLDKYYYKDDPKNLFKISGYTLNSSNELTKNGKQLKLKLFLPDTNPYPKLAETIKQNWETLGVKVEVVALPMPAIISEAIRPRNYDALLFFQANSTEPEAFAFWHSSQVQDPGINITQFKSSAVDALATTARNTLDATLRAELYAKIEDTLIEQAPAVFYGQTVAMTFANPNIRGITNALLPDQTWQLFRVKDWYISTKRLWQK